MPTKKLNIAVIGSGISGLSCAWLLSQRHDVTLFEKDDRIGGHSNTVDVDICGQTVPVDTGFIVYNPPNYPNLVAMFDHLSVPVKATDMSFAVSLDEGRLEYNGESLAGMFVQKRNLLRPSYLRMIADILRFYRMAPELLDSLSPGTTLGELLQRRQFGQAFVENHLLPMGAAIWSTPAAEMLDYPASSFLRFCDNHGLLQLADRPPWYTVEGGSREYVNRLVDAIGPSVFANRPVQTVIRDDRQVSVRDAQGNTQLFDHVVFASHGDQVLGLLADADASERSALRDIRYTANRAVLHGDTRLLPKRRGAWASWCYLGNTGRDRRLSVSYYMNRLQSLPVEEPLVVTLNPHVEPADDLVYARFDYDHPVFDSRMPRAQKRTWQIQGHRNTWYCGAWLGYGFHEDGLQSGLVVAEAIGGLRRPWRVNAENGRLDLPDDFGGVHEPESREAA